MLQESHWEKVNSLSKFSWKKKIKGWPDWLEKGNI